MATKTISKWNPFGVSLNVTATSGTVTRTSATKFTVALSVSWKTYYSGNKTNYGMTATSGGKSVTINPFGTKASSGSGTLTGTYSISGNGSATKTIDVVFKNFNTDNGDSATKTVSLSVTVPAWTSYKVTYNANGGTGAPASQTKWKGQTLTLSSTKPTRTGYTFQGWGTSASDTSVNYAAGASYTANAAITLYAIWKINTWTVSYNANGGTGAPANQTKTYGVTLALSTTKPTRTGYNFKGWGTSASDTTVDYAAGANYTANAAITLYAIWTRKTYTVTYNANGGSGAPANQTKTYGVTLTLSTTVPTRSNYNFKGWATSASSTTISYKAGASYTANANITLYAVWEVAYKKPTISSLTVTRCDANGKSVGDDVEYTSGLVSFKWTTFYTVSSITIKWVSGSGEVTGSKTVDITSGGISGTVSEIFGDDLLPLDQSFTISVIVADSGGSITKEVTLEGYLFTIDMLGGGKGVAFGKPAEIENTADFAFKTRHRERAIFDNNKCIYGTKPDGTVWEALNPVNGSGNTVLGYGNYTKKFGNTNVYGYDVTIGVSSLATADSYKPYIRQGDSFNVHVYTAGFLSAGNAKVYFTIPLTRPIIGEPTVVCTSNGGFRMRQNGSYTHGCTSSTFVIPSSLSASAFYTVGVIVEATFTDTTKSVNNAPIGIDCYVTLTFS